MEQPGDEIRDAIRSGLREEASPLSRRLAEVKGLSNNAIRRLERIDETIAAERQARVDDLALLVDLVTESWRSLAGRLDRIEPALQALQAREAPEPEGAEVYRLPSADTAG